MKNSIQLFVVFFLVLIACTNNKTTKYETINKSELDGMWTLKSGKWMNEDGTFLTYPEDSITEGGKAYVIYSKGHYTVVADVPKMKYFRGEMGEYSINGDMLESKILISNIESNLGLKNSWNFKQEKGIITFQTEGIEEVWERIE